MKPIEAAQLGLLTLIWGSSYLLIKVAVGGMTPLTLVAGRIVCGALVLLAALLLLHLRLPTYPSIWLHLTVMAVLGNVIPFLALTWGEERVSSSLASILNATTPFFTLLFAASLFAAERWTCEKIAGIVVGFGGVALLTGSDLAHIASSSGQGVLAVLLSSVCYGFTYAYARRFVHGDPRVLAACQILVAAVILTPLALLFGHVGATALTPARFASWLILGVVGTGAAYILYYRLIAAIGATRSSYTTYLIPIVGVTWGWLLLSEPVGWNTLGGVAVILCGLVIAGGRIGLLARRVRRKRAQVSLIRDESE